MDAPVKLTLRRKPTRVTAAMEQEMIRLRGQGLTYKAVGAKLNVHPRHVIRLLDNAAARARVTALEVARSVDKQALRERQKEKLAKRLEDMTEKACDLVESTIQEGSAKDFAQAMQGIERLDKVSGNTVGEGTRVIHEGLPQQAPQVELKLLIQQVLGRA